MPQLTLGLLGASYVAASRMVPAFRAHGISPAGVYDSEPRRLRHWQDDGLDLLTTDLDAFLSADIDAVYISSRNEQHPAHAIAAAEAGKHVLLEKPMALSLADARDIVSAADRNGVQLAVNHHLPGSPLHVTARKLVADGRIGGLLSARVNHAVLLPDFLRGWRLSDASGGGVIFDITVHDASVLNPLCGEPLRVGARSVRQASWNTAGGHDSVMTIIEYAGTDGRPVLAQTHDAFGVPYPGTSMEIHGETGAIVILDAMTQDTPGTLQVHDDHGIQTVDVDCSQDLYDINVTAFLAAVEGTGTPTATGHDGLRALQVALAATESVRSGAFIPIDALS
jgi:1,5-anhydro-D-fructose reductase (1,5-anhydro-D-mannitol-forming)